MSDWRIWFKRNFTFAERQAARSFEKADTAYSRQDYETALPLYEESLIQFRALERWDMVLPLRLQLGYVTRLTGDYPAARAHLEQAISLARNLKHDDHLELALIGLASIAAHQGEIDLAERLCAECLQREQLPEKALVYAALQSLLGAISKTMPEGCVHFERALEIYREKEFLEGIRNCLCSLGHCTEPGQDNSRQRVWLQECLDLCEKHEAEKTRSYALNNLGNIERFEGDFDRAMELYRESLRLKQQLGDEWAIAYTLEGCAAVSAARQQGAKAARLLGKASEIRLRLGAPLERPKQPEYTTILTQVRELLNAAEFELAWEEGRLLSVSQAIAEAVAEQDDGASLV
jgi:tetratricopeptide (TPR) repeat protein